MIYPKQDSIYLRGTILRLRSGCGFGSRVSGLRLKGEKASTLRSRCNCRLGLRLPGLGNFAGL